MKLVKEVKRLEAVEDLKVGDYYELENIMSCDKIVVKIVSVDQSGVKAIKLSTGKVEHYTYEALGNFEAKKMKLVYDDNSNILSQAAQVKKEPTKKECEKATDEYAKKLEEIMNNFGINARVVNVGV